MDSIPEIGEVSKALELWRLVVEKAGLSADDYDVRAAAHITRR